MHSYLYHISNRYMDNNLSLNIKRCKIYGSLFLHAPYCRNFIANEMQVVMYSFCVVFFC
jgi:hypothetical protein